MMQVCCKYGLTRNMMRDTMNEYGVASGHAFQEAGEPFCMVSGLLGKPARLEPPVPCMRVF